MNISTATDISVVANDTAEEVTLLVGVQAPEAADQAERQPATLIVVLDRSGSMGSGRLASAKESLLSLVDRLSPHDRFGLVTFDSEVDVVVPAAPLHDRQSVKQRISALRTGGATNLSGGYLRGVEEAYRAAGGAPSTVLLLSDGRANVGVTDADTVASLAVDALGRGITTGTLGVGLGYDERLLVALAQGGSGNHYFAETPDEAAEAFAAEVGGLLDVVAQATTVALRPGPAVDQVHLVNQTSCTLSEEGLSVEVGDLYAGELRKLVFTLTVNRPADVGRTRLAEIKASWADVTTASRCATTVVTSLDVVDANLAADRAVDEEVRGERALLEAQDHRRRAADAVARGDFETADAEFDTAVRMTEDTGALPAPLQDELDEDRTLNLELARRMRRESQRTAKAAYAAAYRASGKRGRGNPSRHVRPEGDPQDRA